MDPCRFDTLVRTLTTGPSRRRLLGVLSALPLVGTALVGSDEDSGATTGKGRGKRRGKRQATSPEAQSCARRCRTKTTKHARRRCRKGCQTPTECTTNADCPSGELCESGRCIPIPDQCTSDADCDACERCDGGVCVAQCQPDEVCRANQCEAVQCTSDRECGDCSRCQDGRCQWQCSPTERCLSGAGGRCCQPRSCPAGLDCGTVDDGCGGQVRCGPQTCTQPANPCQQTTCQANVCITGPRHDGASCDGGNVCCAGTCQQCCDASDCSPCSACTAGACVAITSLYHTCDGPCPTGQWCDAGVCASIADTVRLPDCQSLCSASTEVCGQMVTCPNCNRCDSQTGCGVNYLFDGSLGAGYYCSRTQTTPQVCNETNADCASAAPYSYCADAISQPGFCARICPY